MTKASRETEELLNAIVKVRFFFSYLRHCHFTQVHSPFTQVHRPFTQVYLQSTKDHRRITQT